jgi:hypothetical protein
MRNQDEIWELKEFMEHLKKSEEKFERFWSSHRMTNPTHFPEKMLSGDWWEQFALFEDTEVL